MRKLPIWFVLFLATIAVQAQEVEQGTTEETADGTNGDIAADVEEKEEVQSITEERRELLLYGIDNQVIELINKLTTEEDDLLAGEVLATFKMSRNPNLKSEILEYFSAIDFRGARDEALEIVDGYDTQPAELVRASIDYLTKNPEPELAARLTPILDSPDSELARMALKGIGSSEDEAAAEMLLELLDDTDYPADLKPDIILALGDLKNPMAVEPLIDILEDEREEATWRRYACASLGKIGDPAALPVIEQILYDEDPMLRNYAVGSLRYFDNQEVVGLLIAALKDSFWRVRVNAASGLGKLQAVKAVPILMFKAEKDPEMNVRLEAVRALGEIADPQSLEALRGFYLNEFTPPGLRVESARILAEKDIDESVDLFRKVIEKHWGNDRTRILEWTAQILSKTESDLLDSLYARFLESGDIVVMIYGIRGIARNNAVSLKEEIERLSGEDNHRSIRKEALAALEQLE